MTGPAGAAFRHAHGIARVVAAARLLREELAVRVMPVRVTVRNDSESAYAVLLTTLYYSESAWQRLVTESCL